MFPNSATVLRPLLCCNLLKTQHTGKTHKELQRQGDPVSIRRFCFTRFTIFHLFIGSPGLHTALKGFIPLNLGVFSGSAPPACATPGQEGHVTTPVITSACGGFNSRCTHPCEVPESREYNSLFVISYNYYLPKDQLDGCCCFKVRHLESLWT